MTNVDWAARQRDAHARFEAIKSREAAAMLNGENYDISALIDAESELELLRTAEGEDLRRLEAEEAKAREARIDAIRSEIRDLVSDRGDIIDAAEDAATAFVDQLAALLKNGDEIDKRLKQLNLHAPQTMSAAFVKSTVAYRLCRLLWPVTGKSLGCITVNGPLGHVFPDGSKPEESWRQADSRMNNLRALKGQKS